MSTISAFPSYTNDGLMLEPVDREVMVVEKYNYDTFIDSLLNSPREEVPTQDVPSTPENTYKVPNPSTPFKGSQTLKRLNRWVEPTLRARRRLFEESNEDDKHPHVFTSESYDSPEAVRKVPPATTVSGGTVGATPNPSRFYNPHSQDRPEMPYPVTPL